MNMKLKLIAGAAIALAMTSIPALADGMAKKSYAEPKEGCDNRFGGAFIGGNLGTATLSSRVTDRDGLHTNDEGGTQTWTHDRTSYAIGGSAGYNVQKCAAVFGIVGDVSWNDVDNKRNYLSRTQAPNFAGQDRVTNSLDWLMSLRTRGGLAIDNLFLYTTGGIAFANAGLQVSSDRVFNSGAGPNPATLGGQVSDWRFGWVGGVGTEYAINDKISLTSEALYYDFGTKNVGITSSAGQLFSFEDHKVLWVARMGVNIKIGN